MIEVNCPQCDGHGWVTQCQTCGSDEEFCTCGSGDLVDVTCWRCDGRGHVVSTDDRKP